jgi:dGTPase
MRWDERQEVRNVQPDDPRGEADVDYARVIHSGSFRRLQGKTQTLNLGDSDFYRTRLTHSLEVAQIAGGIELHFQKKFQNHPAIKYLPDTRMIQAIALTHDLGHPPFGHGGEIALNYCMRDDGGFEGNGQTLRILSRLEKFSDKCGANLTRRTLLGVLKYPVLYNVVCNPIKMPQLHADTTSISIIDRKASKPPKCYMQSEQDVVDWILAPLEPEDRSRFCSFEQKIDDHHKANHKSFDCSIIDLADDIAFGVHDLEDALSLRLLNQEDFRELVPEVKCLNFLAKL